MITESPIFAFGVKLLGSTAQQEARVKIMVARNRLFAIFLLALCVSFPATAVSGQFSGATGAHQQQVQEQTALKEYRSEYFGVSFNYPANYSFDNKTEVDQSIRDLVVSMLGYDLIGTLCPTDVTLPSLGGGVSCIGNPPLIEETRETPRTMTFIRIPDLATKIREEMGGSSSTTTTAGSLTPRDAFAWYIAAVLDKDDPETEYIDESRGIKQLVSTKNFTVPITQPDTGQILGQAPAILVEYTYNFNKQGGLLRLVPDVRTYHVFVQQGDNAAVTFGEEARAEFMPTGQVPPLLQTVVDSFRLVDGSGQATTTKPSTPPPPNLQQQTPQPPQRQQQPQSQQPQNQGASVSIVPGSSSLTDTAFSPNPVEVSVGDTVTWTNDDTQPHTVVSGANAQPSGEFDSSPNFNPLIAPRATFEHTFTQPGDYPYYCALHPNMVGTVSVG